MHPTIVFWLTCIFIIQCNAQEQCKYEEVQKLPFKLGVITRPKFMLFYLSVSFERCKRICLTNDFCISFIYCDRNCYMYSNFDEDDDVYYRKESIPHCEFYARKSHYDSLKNISPMLEKIDFCLAPSTNDCDEKDAICIYFEDEHKYACYCRDGFTYNGTYCVDEDECAIGFDDCHDNAVCINIYGAFECECKDGYTGNGYYCEDIDECTEDTNPCTFSNFECSNSVGSYECVCKANFILEGESCVPDTTPQPTEPITTSTNVTDETSEDSYSTEEIIATVISSDNDSITDSFTTEETTNVIKTTEVTQSTYTKSESNTKLTSTTPETTSTGDNIPYTSTPES